MKNETHECSTCHEDLPLTEFYFHKSRGRYSWMCKTCCKARRRKRYLANRNDEVCKTFQRRFGITMEDRDRMFKEQNGKCLICQSTMTINNWGQKGLSACIDHCHTNGHVRGLLCNFCNKGIGHFFDNPETLRSAARYLEEDNAKRTDTK